MFTLRTWTASAGAPTTRAMLSRKRLSAPSVHFSSRMSSTIPISPPLFAACSSIPLACCWAAEAGAGGMGWGRWRRWEPTGERLRAAAGGERARSVRAAPGGERERPVRGEEEG
eukprot:1561507-Rhodomonas_salina.2